MNQITSEDKRNMVIACIILILTVIFALFFNRFIRNDGVKSSNKYFIFGDYLILQKTNTSWIQKGEFDKKLANLTYTITNGKRYLSDVKLEKATPSFWYFYDKNYNQINMKDFRCAGYGLRCKLAYYERDNTVLASNDENIDNFLNNENITRKREYIGSKIITDLNGDGENEFIYTITNFSLADAISKVKGYLFIVSDGNIVRINEIDNNSFNVMDIADLNNDGIYEIIVSKGVKDIPNFNSCYLIYKFKNNNLVLKKDCR